MSAIVRRLILTQIGWMAATSAIPAEGSDKLRVVTTTTDLAAIARAVGGDKVEVAAIATGREDPHFIAAKPSYMMAARKADLWIRVGLELEIGNGQRVPVVPWEGRIVRGGGDLIHVTLDHAGKGHISGVSAVKKGVDP